MTVFAVDAVLFDLDGTLLDTIEDLAEGANRMLAEIGRPLRSLAEIHSFVGKGIPNLVRRCLTEGSCATEEEIEVAVAVFRRHYAVVNGRSGGAPDTLAAADAPVAWGPSITIATTTAGGWTG